MFNPFVSFKKVQIISTLMSTTSTAFQNYVDETIHIFKWIATVYTNKVLLSFSCWGPSLYRRDVLNLNKSLKFWKVIRCYWANRESIWGVQKKKREHLIFSFTAKFQTVVVLTCYYYFMALCSEDIIRYISFIACFIASFTKVDRGCI